MGPQSSFPLDGAASEIKLNEAIYVLGQFSQRDSTFEHLPVTRRPSHVEVSVTRNGQTSAPVHGSSGLCIEASEVAKFTVPPDFAEHIPATCLPVDTATNLR